LTSGGVACDVARDSGGLPHGGEDRAKPESADRLWVDLDFVEDRIC
jgi:hypothetical protein